MGCSVNSFYVDLTPKRPLSSFELANLFLNCNEFNTENFKYPLHSIFSSESWNSDDENEDASFLNIENKSDYPFSVITNITEDNWKEIFLEDEYINQKRRPNLMFFKLHPDKDKKVFVCGEEY